MFLRGCRRLPAFTATMQYLGIKTATAAREAYHIRYFFLCSAIVEQKRPSLVSSGTLSLCQQKEIFRHELENYRFYLLNQASTESIEEIHTRLRKRIQAFGWEEDIQLWDFKDRSVQRPIAIQAQVVQVVPRLWIGSLECLSREDVLKTCSIDAIVVAFEPNDLRKHPSLQKRNTLELPLALTEEAPTLRQLQLSPLWCQTTPFILDSMSRSQSVLIAISNGLNVAPALCAAYLIQQYEVNYRIAAVVIEAACRSVAFPSEYVKQLEMLAAGSETIMDVDEPQEDELMYDTSSSYQFTPRQKQ